METVRREALKRQLADVLGKLDTQRDAALTHELLQLSSAMASAMKEFFMMIMQVMRK